MIVTQPVDPAPDEPCDTAARFPVGYVADPNPSDSPNEWRSPFLAEFTPLVGQPLVLLHRSSQAFLAASAAGADAASWTTRGTALADLAVSGTATFDAFRAAAPKDGQLESALNVDPGPSAPPLTPTNVSASVGQALDRAYAVAYALRGYGHRAPLGRIECGGEADTPHRPVNVAAIPHRQFDLRVPMGAGLGAGVRTRFSVVAGPPDIVDDPRVPGWVADRVPPADFVPVVPFDMGIILYVHGHMSRLEECGDLAPLLAAPGSADGDHGPFAVVAMDLPCCGYADKLDVSLVDPGLTPADWDLPTFTMLDFVQQFVVNFVEALGAAVGRDLRPQMASIVGGSLGGNTVLRIAESGVASSPGTVPVPWTQNLVAWSPASVWAPLTDLITSAGPKTCLGKALEPETPDSRAQYFSDVFDSQTVPFLVPAQPETWYRDDIDWAPCKQAEIWAARADRQEVYHEQFRRFHWLVAMEQLVFSHVAPANDPPCARASSRLLVASGALDLVPTNDIYTATQTMVALMPAVQGTTLFLNDTGHSIHNERPGLLTAAIRGFLPQPVPPAGSPESWDPWTSLGGSGLGGFDVGVDALGRMQVLAVNAAGRPERRAQASPRGAFDPWSAFDAGLPADVVLTGRPAYGANGAPWRLEVFARSGTDTLHDWEERNAEPGTWSGWAGGLIGDPGSDPSVVTKPNGLLVVGVLDPGGCVRIRGQNSLGGWWSESTTIGTDTFARGPWLAPCLDSGLLAAFAVAADGSLHVATTTEANGDTWTAWSDMSMTAAGGVGVAHDRAGLLWVAVCGGDQALHVCQVHPPGGWSIWSTLGGSLATGATPAAVRNVWNGVQIFVRWIDGSVRYVRQDPPGWGWSTWFTLGGTAGSDPVAVTFSNGSAVVVADGAGGLTFCQQS